MSLLERLSDESLDDLSSELSALDAAGMAGFVAALDTLDHLARRLQPAMSPIHPLEHVDARCTDPDNPPDAVTDFMDVEIDEMAAMLIELMSTFESSLEYDAVSNANWCSPSGRCEVSKSGQSAALLWSLQQDPEAVFAEYRVCLDGQEVWLWRDKVWPDLSVYVSVTPNVRIPSICFRTISHYLEQNSAEWVEKWREFNPLRDRSNQTNA